MHKHALYYESISDWELGRYHCCDVYNYCTKHLMLCDTARTARLAFIESHSNISFTLHMDISSSH